MLVYRVPWQANAMISHRYDRVQPHKYDESRTVAQFFREMVWILYMTLLQLYL